MICETVNRHADYLIPRIQAVPPQHAAILPSEMLAFCAYCREHCVERVVESGRRYGYSTDVLSRMDWEVISIELNPEPTYDARLRNVQLVKGDGEELVPTLVDENTAVLLDGPKGLKAWRLWKAINPSVCGIHDAYPGTEIRELATDAVLTDRQEFVDEFGWLDMEMLRFRGFNSHSELLPNGSVLAILE